MANKFEEIMIDLPNIRCMTCGKVIGHLHNRLEGLRSKNYTNEEIFGELGLSRPCCRVAMINPPKYSMVGIVDENESRVGETLREKEQASLGQGDKNSDIRNRLLKIKEKQKSEVQNKKPLMSYYAI